MDKCFITQKRKPITNSSVNCYFDDYFLHLDSPALSLNSTCCIVVCNSIVSRDVAATDIPGETTGIVMLLVRV